MTPDPAQHNHLELLIELALAEDLGAGDVTSIAFIPESAHAVAVIVARQSLVVSGTNAALRVFEKIDSSITLELLAKDGTSLHAGEPILKASGPARSLLAAERSALNFLQRLCGIATQTRSYVQQIEGTAALLLDTRKTTPGWRVLEKKAVADGGGTNHRMGLHDMVMVKDNHLAALPTGVDAAEIVAGIKARNPAIPVEIEADNLEQVEFFAAIPGVDWVMLDNMPPDIIRKALVFRRPGLRFEASGGISHEKLREIAETGVDAISMGALTHSAVAVDIGMDFLQN